MARPIRTIAVALLAVSPALAISACKEVEATESSHYEPAKLSAIKDSDVQRVTFTAVGAKRIGLEMGEVRASRRGPFIPHASVIYDAEGKVFTYTSPKRLTFVRHEIVVDRIDGDRVLLTKGPSIGTKVVTVGAAEVLGSEFEVGH
jgi:hypothetical protein